MINMAAASLLSTNTLDYCYTFRQKALLRNSSLSPRRFLTGVAMEYVLRYASASPSGTASASDLVSPRFPWLLLHGNFNSDAVWIRFQNAHFFLSKQKWQFYYMKKMAHFQEVFEFITAWADCFDLFSQMLLCHTVVSSPAQAFFIEALLPTQNGHHQTHSYR